MPKESAKWYSIRRKAAIAAAAAGALAAAEIFIYGDIGESWWEETVTAAQFVKDLNELQVDQITVRINSMGGSVPDGLAIYNAMKRHPATITTEIDGMAFSIASLIAMGGDKVHMANNALLMIHAPWTIVAGNAAELREAADRLDTWAAGMATSYATKSGKTTAEISKLFADGKDHYYTAEEAKAENFIDAISDEAAPDALAAARMVASTRYSDMPAAWLPAGPGKPAAAPAAAPSVAVATQTQEPDMNIKRNRSILATALLMAAAGAEGSETSGTGSGSPAPAPAAATPSAPAPQAGAREEEIRAAERTRQASIRASAKPFLALAGVSELVDRLCGETVSAEQAAAQILAHVGKDSAPIAGGRVVTLQDEADKIRAAQVDVLLARANVRNSDGKQIVVAGNPFRGHTLLDMAKAALARAGVRTDGMDKMQIVAAAFTQTTSDFPVLLENTMHKSMQAAYAVQANTWRRWARQGTVSDFRAHPRYRKGSFGVLDVINEAGEIKNKAIPDGEKASITAGTKGNIVNLTRQAVINDDLGAFVGIAQDLGSAAARTVEVDAIALLVSNPVMPDGVQLFHATHKNLGTAGAPSVTTIDETRQLMASQKDVSGNDYLDLRPAVWVGPMSLGGSVRVINSSQYDPDAANKLQRPNLVNGLFRDVIDTPRLAGTAWYSLADKDEAPVIEVAFLDGNDTPYLELQNGFTVDGAQWKVRLDYGVGAIDFRGGVKNTG